MFKSRFRKPLLRALRSLPPYRALSGVPRNAIASCADIGAERYVALDAPIVVPVAERLASAGIVDDGTLPVPDSYVVPATSVTTIRRGRLYGKGVAAIAPDGRVLRDATVYLSGPIEDHSVMRRFFLPRLRELRGTSAVVSTPGGNTYYHWILEVLPRLELLRRAGIDLAALDHLVVTSLRHRFQRETLALFGIEPRRVVSSDAARHLVLERMVLPSFAAASGYPAPWVVPFLRRTFAPALSRPAEGPRRIYVSRTRSKNRRVANLDALRPLFDEHGVVELFPEDHSVSEQVVLFANAELVIGPHGSGLTNLAFCRPGTRVIELFHPDQSQTYYPILSALAGLAYRPLRGTRAVGPYRLEDFEVDPKALGRALAKSRA